MLVITVDSAETASSLVMGNVQLASENVFYGNAANFCILSPSDIEMEAARELMRFFWSDSFRRERVDYMSTFDI